MPIFPLSNDAVPLAAGLSFSAFSGIETFPASAGPAITRTAKASEIGTNFLVADMVNLLFLFVVWLVPEEENSLHVVCPQAPGVSTGGARREDQDGDENHQTGVLPRGQAVVPCVGQSQEIQEEAGRDVEEHECNREVSRRPGPSISQEEYGHYHQKHVQEFIPAKVVERHLRKFDGRREFRQAAGIPVEGSDVSAGIRGCKADAKRERCDRAGMIVCDGAGEAADRPCEGEDEGNCIQEYPAFAGADTACLESEKKAKVREDRPRIRRRN
jgi:hypothetical protein